MANGGAREKILPFYIVIDTSLSMRSCLEALDTGLNQLQKTIATDATVSELARVAIISFNSEARQELRLSDLARLEDGLPKLKIGGQTNYRAAFELLRDAIEHEITWYLDSHYRVLRPTVYFITDGQPSDDDWAEAHNQLTSPELFPFHPNIVSFGFGQVDEETLRATATYKAFVASEGAMPATVLAQIARELTNSIVASARSAPGEDESSLMLNEDIPGMADVSEGIQEITIDLLNR